MEEKPELIEPETSVSEQIEKTSINIYTFSMLDEESGIPMNFPLILGGEDIITDINSKLKVEEAFGQLNLQSLFGFERHVFRSVVYDTFHLNGDPEALTPNVYIQKAFTNNVYLFNYLSTPYSDLNIESTFEEIDFMSRALSGVFRRASAQVKSNAITNEHKFEICKENVDHLGGFMHYKIFTERDFREPKTSTKKPSHMILGLFLELVPQASEFQCVGNCGLTFRKDDPLFDGRNPREVGCPNGDPEKLVLAPPALKLENIQFVLPPKAEKILSEFSEEDLSPSVYLGYFTGVFMPRNIALTVNKLAPEHFQDLVSIPRKAFYSNKINFEDFVKIECNFRLENSKVIVFASISDSRYSESKYKDLLVSSLSSVTLNRDIVEGFKKGFSLEKILRGSVINDWMLTEKIPAEQIGDYFKITDIPTTGGNQ